MDEVQRQFVDEAREIVEKLYRDVEHLRAVRSHGRQRRELAARIFRRVHTLKGSAGSFGMKAVSQVAHEFEGVLDGVRLGRVPIDDALIDVFEDATNAIAQALAGSSATGDSGTKALISRLHAIASASAQQGTIASGLRSTLPAEIARALSEYDLQHAREAVREGAKLFIVSAAFEIETFDERFRALSKLLGQSGEVIATVPGEPAAAGEINFRLLYAAELVSQKSMRVVSELGRIQFEEIKIAPADAPQAAVENVISQTALAGARASVNVELDHLSVLISDASDLFRDTTNALRSLRTPANEEVVAATAERLRRRFVELEERLIKLRLVPLAEILERAAVRAGRIAARQLGKDVEFEIAGGEVGIDKSLADTIAEPLLHLVRNAIGHGIEPAEERIAAGKNSTGKVKLAAFSEGSRIHISISDDGRGINFDRVVSAATSHGIADTGPNFSMDQCLRLIFRPGFSTANEISELSGRGIGLDIVDRAMEQAGGEVRVATQPGAGTTFAMILPATLTLVQCVVVRSDGRFYCIESSSVSHLGSLEKQIESNGSIDWQGEKLPLVRLRSLLAQPPVDTESARAMIVWEAANPGVARAGGPGRLALVVDAITGQQETLVRSLGRHAARWHGISGAAELFDGNVALVLDLKELVKTRVEG